MGASSAGVMMEVLFFEHRIVYRSASQRSRPNVSPWLAGSGVSLPF
jgi:hypothetical protein